MKRTFEGDRYPDGWKHPREEGWSRGSPLKMMWTAETIRQEREDSPSAYCQWTGLEGQLHSVVGDDKGIPRRTLCPLRRDKGHTLTWALSPAEFSLHSSMETRQ